MASKTGKKKATAKKVQKSQGKGVKSEYKWNERGSIVTRRDDPLPDDLVEKLRALMNRQDEDLVDRFLSTAAPYYHRYHDEMRARVDLLDSKDASRHMKAVIKLVTQCQDGITRLLEFDEDHGFILDLRVEARKHEVAIDKLILSLTKISSAIEHVDTRKYQHGWTMQCLYLDVYREFERVFGMKPEYAQFQSLHDVPAETSLQRLFVPILAILARRSVKHVGEQVQKFLPS